MILIRFSELTELITLPLRVIADLIRNPLPTTHLTKGLRVKPAMTGNFEITDTLDCFTTFAMTARCCGKGLLDSLARICNSCHTNATHGLQIRASRLRLRSVLAMTYYTEKKLVNLFNLNKIMVQTISKS